MAVRKLVSILLVVLMVAAVCAFTCLGASAAKAQTEAPEAGGQGTAAELTIVSAPLVMKLMKELAIDALSPTAGKTLGEVLNFIGPGSKTEQELTEINNQVEQVQQELKMIEGQIDSGFRTVGLQIDAANQDQMGEIARQGAEEDINEIIFAWNQYQDLSKPSNANATEGQMRELIQNEFLNVLDGRQIDIIVSDLQTKIVPALTEGDEDRGLLSFLVNKLIANNNLQKASNDFATDEVINITYLQGDGTEVAQEVTVPAQTRVTLDQTDVLLTPEELEMVRAGGWGSAMDRYLILENYFTKIMNWQLRGIIMVVEALNYKQQYPTANCAVADRNGNAVHYLNDKTDSVKDIIDAEIDNFLYNVEKLVLSMGTPGNNGLALDLPPDATNIFARADMFCEGLRMFEKVLEGEDVDTADVDEWSTLTGRIVTYQGLGDATNAIMLDNNEPLDKKVIPIETGGQKVQYWPSSDEMMITDRFDVVRFSYQNPSAGNNRVEVNGYTVDVPVYSYKAKDQQVTINNETYNQTVEEEVASGGTVNFGSFLHNRLGAGQVESTKSQANALGNRTIKWHVSHTQPSFGLVYGQWRRMQSPVYGPGRLQPPWRRSRVYVVQWPRGALEQRGVGGDCEVRVYGFQFKYTGDTPVDANWNYAVRFSTWQRQTGTTWRKKQWSQVFVEEWTTGAPTIINLALNVYNWSRGLGTYNWNFCAGNLPSAKFCRDKNYSKGPVKIILRPGHWYRLVFRHYMDADGKTNWGRFLVYIDPMENAIITSP